jgi:hypothetical protein
MISSHENLQFSMSLTICETLNQCLKFYKLQFFLWLGSNISEAKISDTQWMNKFVAVMIFNVLNAIFLRGERIVMTIQASWIFSSLLFLLLNIMSPSLKIRSHKENIILTAGWEIQFSLTQNDTVKHKHEKNSNKFIGEK